MSALSPILSCYRYTSLHLPIRTVWKLRDPLVPCRALPVHMCGLCEPCGLRRAVWGREGVKKKGINVTIYKEEKDLGVIIQDTMTPDRHMNELLVST